MIYNLSAASGPASPVTLDEMKAWLRVTHAEHNAMITSLLVSAAEQVEQATGLALSSRVFTYTATAQHSHLMHGVQLPRRPITAIGDIKVFDDTGEDTTLVEGSDYYIGRTSAVRFRGGRVILTGGVLSVAFTAGFANANAVPETIKTIIKREVAKQYTYSADVIVGTAVIRLPKDAMDALLQFREFAV